MAAFHSGDQQAAQYLASAEAKWQRLQVSDESLAALASMGFSTQQARPFKGSLQGQSLSSSGGPSKHMQHTFVSPPEDLGRPCQFHGLSARGLNTVGCPLVWSMKGLMQLLLSTESVAQ